MHIRARASDWHSDNPNVKPAAWFGAFAVALVLCILIAGLIGSFVNGNGSPFLS